MGIAGHGLARMQVEGNVQLLHLGPEGTVPRIIQVHVFVICADVRIAVSQDADEPELVNRVVQLLDGHIGILQRQCGKSAEPVRMSLYGRGEVLVGFAGNGGRLLRIGYFLDGR